jgi:hypothetical protein
MQTLPVGTRVFRNFDEAVYIKQVETDDPKKPSKWVSEKQNSIFVSDIAIQTNHKQYKNLELS